MKMCKQIGEAVVFEKEVPHSLANRNIQSGSLKLYKRATQSEDEILYAPNVDYIVNEQDGIIRRTKDSRIPDWSRHIFYGQQKFDQTGLNDYSNEPFTLYADYCYLGDMDAAENVNAPIIKAVLPVCSARHLAGEPIVYVVYGDSISTGAEASQQRYAYSYLLYESLKKNFPNSPVHYEMKAIGGETSKGGLNRLADDVIAVKPQLVTIGYGMNDQNRLQPHSNDIPVEQFKGNIRQMVESLRSQAQADIILVTPCAPNPLWKFSSGEIGQYAEALRAIGKEYEIPVADAYAVWMEQIEAGKTYESLLLNNINHPNDYGHSIYFQAFERLWQTKL